MTIPYQLKIDAYAHIVPPRYREAVYKIDPKLHDEQFLFSLPLYDLDARFRLMDK